MENWIEKQKINTEDNLVIDLQEAARRKKFIALFAVAFLIISTGIVFYLVSVELSAPDTFPVNKVVSIERGKSLKQVSAQFKEQKIIRSEFIFETAGWLMKTEKNIKAGEYVFEKPLNVYRLMLRIAGDEFAKSSLKVTVPEGYTLRGMAALFENRGLWSAEDFYVYTGAPAVDCRKSVCADKKSEIAPSSFLLAEVPHYVSLEGFLFPDTYDVPSNYTPKEMIKIMLENFEKKMTPELQSDIKKSGKSLYSIVTMASLLEKEADNDEDKRIISGILWKRMEKGMPLQVDAVFPYIIGKGSADLTLDDLKIDSPYNTYLYKGLPLGPISNPGLESIKAALYPKTTPFLYYLSDKDGKTYYSISYDEHLVKKAKYLK
jgi:UPF0755 protein